MSRRLLYIDANLLVAYQWRNNGPHCEGVFHADAHGMHAFARYLQAHRGAVFHVLADLADEGFHQESVPFVQGSDRAAMLSRKLSQFFYGASFAGAISQGREKSGRRDERILFTALTRSQALDPWLAQLHEAEAALAGVWSVPLVSPPLLQQLGITAERVLLVHITLAGIRQTYFEHGHLRFSRLTPVATPNATLSASCATECAKLYQYLVGQRIITRGSQLPVLVLVHPSRIAQFRDDCRSGDELQYALMDLHFACRQVGLQVVPPDMQSETLFLHLSVRQPQKVQLAPPTERRFFRLWQTRFVLRSAGAVALIACLLVAARHLVEMGVLRQDAAQVTADLRSDRLRRQALLAALPPLPAARDDLRSIDLTVRALEHRSATLPPALLALSRALDANADVELERIDWQLADAADAPPGKRDADAAMPQVVMTVDCTLPVALAGDRRGAIDAANRFAAAIASDGAWQVTVVRQPFAFHSDSTLRSAEDARPMPPAFSVRMVGKIT